MLFRSQVRKTIYNNEWWFVVNDVVNVLTDTPDAKDYVRKMRIRDEELSKGWGQIVTPLSVETEGGPQKLNCANTNVPAKLKIKIFERSKILLRCNTFVLQLRRNNVFREFRFTVKLL